MAAEIYAHGRKNKQPARSTLKTMDTHRSRLCIPTIHCNTNNFQGGRALSVTDTRALLPKAHAAPRWKST